MKHELIKPIPQYILTKIRRLDKKRCPEQKGPIRMYSYLTKIRGELVEITVAVRNHRKQWYAKQVAAHGVKSDKCCVKDMEYMYMGGMGFRVGWHAEGLSKYQKWYEDGKWCYAKHQYYNAWTTTVNPEFICKFPEYRYSARQFFHGRCLIQYLRIYEKYPQTEYLLKSGLFKLHDSVTVLKRVAKDKKFCKWLIAHKDEIAGTYCYVGSIMQAYKSGKPIARVQAFNERKKKLNGDESFRPIKELFGKDRGPRSNLERFFSYLDEQDAGPRSYLDYLTACNYLGLDMNLPKNRFPHNFRRWHDIRIDQYHAARALADEQERAELYKQFAAIAQKYTTLQKLKGGPGRTAGYAVLIATSPADLLREGEALSHCVGKMNYGQKVAREEVLIFFVRDSHNPDTPFVTVEYSLKSKKVLQCYGYGNTKPDEPVLHYVHKVWQPYANRNLKKLTNKIKAA